MWLAVGFPRDGTSRDNPGRVVRLSLCPRTKVFPCPVVPLSQDKGKSKNPGTNFSVPGRQGQNHFPQKTGKGCSETGKGCSKTGKVHSKQEKMF